MSRLTEFYLGAGNDGAGRTIAQVWDFTDDALEEHHDFIQWLFPLREPSRFNPDAPLLSNADIAAFQADDALRANLSHSFDRFLAFLGLARVDGTVQPGAEFANKREIWLYPNHNWLRITRVLHSLRLLGLADEAGAFFRCLTGLREQGAARIASDTWAYWQDASSSV